MVNYTLKTNLDNYFELQKVEKETAPFSKKKEPLTLQVLSIINYFSQFINHKTTLYRLKRMKQSSIRIYNNVC